MNLSPGVISALISAPVAFFIAIFAERIRAYCFKPLLICEYEHSAGYNVKNDDMNYVKIKVSNSSRNTAKSCKAYLTSVIVINNKKQILFDVPRLGWPHIAQGNSVDIIKGITQYLDIARSPKDIVPQHPRPMLFATSFTPSQLREFEGRPENCRLNGAIITDQGYRKNFTIDLVWNGTWHTLDAKPMKH